MRGALQGLLLGLAALFDLSGALAFLKNRATPKQTAPEAMHADFLAVWGDMQTAVEVISEAIPMAVREPQPHHRPQNEPSTP